MTDNAKETEGRIDGAAVMAAIQKLDAKLDSAHTRLDAMERKDAEEKERADKARADAEAKEKEDREKADARKKRHDAARKDRFGKRHDGESYADYVKRHDADEAAMCDAMRKDGAEEKDAREDAARARRDAEEEEKRSDESFEKWAKEEGEEKEHKKDAERADAANRRADAAEAENKELKTRISAIEGTMRSLTAEVPAEERDAIAAAQYHADSVMAMFGERASAPIAGEPALSYRKRLIAKLMKHSPDFKDVKLDSVDGNVLKVIEDRVYADAQEAARRADSATPGILVAHKSVDAAGRTITTFTGDPLAWMGPFMRGGQVGRIIRNPNAH